HFFVGERDGLLVLDGREDRLERLGGRGRAQDDVRGGGGRDVDEAVASAGGDPDAGQSALFQPIDGGARRHRDDRRPVLRDLLRQQLVVLPGGQPDNGQLVRVRVDDRQRALPDGAGGAEDGNALHELATAEDAGDAEDLQLSVLGVLGGR